MPSTADVPQLSEKMALLFSRVEGIRVEGVELQPDSTNELREAPTYHDPLADEETKSPLEITGEENIQLARTFMLERGNEFQWLLQQMKRSARMMSTGTTESRIRTELTEMIGDSTVFTMNLAWDPAGFLTEQYKRFSSVKCRLQEVICLCGSGDETQALSCGEYTARMWPEVGLDLLGCLSDAIESSTSEHRGNRTDICLFPFAC